MDQKLALLSAVHILDKSQVQLSENTMRHLRIILSQFAEEVISEDEYQELVSSLKDESFITWHNDKVLLTPAGGALVHAIGERIMGQTALARLEDILGDYRKIPSQYIRAISERLSQFHETRGEKGKPADKSQIRVVGLLLEIRHKVRELFLHSFKLDPRLMRNEEGIDKEINYQTRKFIETQKTPILSYSEGDMLRVIGLYRITGFTLFGQHLTPSMVEAVKLERVSGWNLLLATTFLESKLADLGYLRARWPGRTLIKYRESKTISTNVGILRESEGINVDYQELEDNHVFVWIETFTSPNKRVLDFIQERVRNISDEQEILACLRGLKLKIIPSGTEVELKGILPDMDLTQKHVPGTRENYAGYWKRAYGITVSPNIQPMLIVKLNDRELSYPAEVAYIDKFSLERHLGTSQIRKPKPESPGERFSKIRDLFDAISASYKKDEGRHYAIHLKRFTPQLEELYNLGGVDDAVRIKQPALNFLGGTVSLDPLDVFEGDYGPVCGRKNLKVTHLVLPQDRTNAEGDAFLIGLQRMFSRTRLGKLTRDQNLRIERYDPKVGSQKLEEKLKSLTKVNGENTLAVAVIPGNNNEYYYSLKRLLPIMTQSALQIVTLSTFEEIVADRFRGEKLLALQILIKSLTQGGAIWNLNNTAGLLKEKTLFVGISFSRNPWQKKFSKCAAVLHDAYGNRVSWKVFSTPEERTITKSWFDTLLYKIADTVEREKPSRLVFYRKGQMSEAEVEAVQSSFDNCNWVHPIKRTFISIMDIGNFRFYLYDQAERKARNLPAGYGIIMNQKEAFLSTSNYDDRELRQGTVIPIQLRREIGDDDILDLLKEYHDLTYLNWPAPTTTGKYPLVVTIAERFAELMRENISAESLLYLDF